MGLLRRIAGFLGFAKDDGPEVKDNEEEDEDDDQAHNRAHFQETGLPRKGFSVPRQVVVDRNLPGPVIVPCRSGDGGVQGLKWHAKRLRIDEDGDVADEFLDEVFPGMSISTENNRALPRFEVKHNTKPAKVKSQALYDGKIRQCVEYRGRSQWR
ncbi:hypothetical protein D8674_028467 [Pyrus ussuriensis x Pyrus communis]|uniref:Uncharacterized protein n=1 Tax=Pyrus ussuriensis x Pyrus communis TaxID=2448454 RepID=A0A5N5I3L5_9ROSA|nr:hypothetical protein D8674_028467 [Pyrus ussuriensis x Pyrus communis]